MPPLFALSMARGTKVADALWAAFASSFSDNRIVSITISKSLFVCRLLRLDKWIVALGVFTLSIAHGTKVLDALQDAFVSNFSGKPIASITISKFLSWVHF
jgi:hypothetical protein